jgi:perosamine synthetase
MDPKRRYYFPVTGYNFRLTNVACAMLCAQLLRRDQLIKRRREIYSLYRGHLGGVPGIGFQPVAPWAGVSPWLFSVTIDNELYGSSRDQAIEKLAGMGIETRPFFLPLHTLPPFREGSRNRGARLPVTIDLAASGMNLPTYSTMTDADVKKVCDAISRIGRRGVS